MSRATKIDLNPKMSHGLAGETYKGQANLACSHSNTCRECKFWGEGAEDYSKFKPGVGAELNDQHCKKALSMSAGNVKLPKIPHKAYACKYFYKRDVELPAKKLGGVDEIALIEKAKDILDANTLKTQEFEERAKCSLRTFKNFALEITNPNRKTIERVKRAIELLEGQVA